jgi:hypothetical protein
MALLLPSLLETLWRDRIFEFRKIYALMTVAIALGAAWVMRRSASAATEKKQAANFDPPRRPALSGTSVAAIALVIAILAGYAIVALKWERFADYDESTFTLFTTQGHNFGPPIWPASGRFFPLGQQEFNVLRHFTSSVAGYHAVPLTELLIVSCIFFFLDDDLSVPARAMLAAGFLILPSVVTSFGGLIFPDRNVVFWLALLLLFVKRFELTRSTVWAVAAVICAQNMLYYKETAFLLLFGFAAGRLISRCRFADRPGWEFSRLRNRESRLDLCFLFLVLVFLIYYTAAMFPHPNMGYAHQFRVPLQKTLLYYLTLDFLALIFVVFTLRRLFLILKRRLTPLPYWDALALGGVAYYAAFLYLRLCRPYYMAPVDFIAVLYVGRFVVQAWGKMRLPVRVTTFAFVVAVLLQGVSLSAFRVYERENMVQAEDQLASAIVSRSQAGANHTQRLYFPFSSTTPIAEFAAYLTYRGANVEGYESKPNSSSPDNIQIADKAFATDGPCVAYRTFVCHAGSVPDPGDLVVELPVDLESQSDLGAYREACTSLFSYEPRPRLPRWMTPLLNHLRVASIRWQPMPLPDRWLHASVTEWK